MTAPPRPLHVCEKFGITILSAMITFVLALQVPLAFRASADVEAITRAANEAEIAREKAAFESGYDGLDDKLVHFSDEEEWEAELERLAKKSEAESRRQSVKDHPAYSRELTDDEKLAWNDPLGGLGM